MVTDACNQANCAGKIEDGYCTICGIARSKQPVEHPRNGSANLRIASSTIVTSTGSTPVSRGASRRKSPGSVRTGSARKKLGAGLVSVPELPSTEPEDALLADPCVPEHKRFCGHCDRQLSRERGFCGKCGRRYSFVPTLKPGNLVGGQYEVKGAIAFGGLGWIYLAFDRLLSRYVVLKGLLNTEDAASAAIAVAERQFLAAVDHPNIVGIYNFVQEGAEGFIVMEYIGGQTLRDIRRSRGPLPPAEALAYVHRILDAFAYLHQKNLVYCDFKPENVMLQKDDLKLIDLGGVRRLDDPNGDIYGTIGYSAPESCDGPSVESDLYTIGRTLAVLLTEIKGFSGAQRYQIPGPEEEPLFAHHESLYRLLLKATTFHPGDRFSSAEEMSEQLLGVLHEFVSVESGLARPGKSSLFSGDMLASTRAPGFHAVTPDYRQLPIALLSEPASDLNPILEISKLAKSKQRAAVLRQMTELPTRSIDARLQLAGNLIEAGCFEESSELLDQLEKADSWNWRVRWRRGVWQLASNRPAEAQSTFDQIYFDLPGETAPKMGFAMAAEAAGNLPLATRMYDLVSRTDPAFPSAAFGLARCLSQSGDRRDAVAALARIAPESSLHICSQVEAARSLVRNGRSDPTLEDVVSAAAAIAALPEDVRERLQLTASLFTVTLQLLISRSIKKSSSLHILGCPLTEAAIRQALEQSLRSLARSADGSEKIRLVDEANRVRPRTLF